MKKLLNASLVLATLALTVAVGSVEATETKSDGNVYHIVAKGDTLDGIAKGYNVSYTVVHANNTDIINNADFIMVGQKILVDGPDFNKEAQLVYTTAISEPVPNLDVEATYETTTNVADVDYSEAEQPTPAVEEETAPVITYEEASQAEVSTTYVPSGDNWHKANRREVESTNNYNTFTGNGYLGAYQFSPQTWNSIASSHGLDASDFSPANQDRFADIYAQERYNGWSNVPTTGGW